MGPAKGPLGCRVRQVRVGMKKGDTRTDPWRGGGSVGAVEPERNFLWLFFMPFLNTYYVPHTGLPATLLAKGFL